MRKSLNPPIEINGRQADTLNVKRIDPTDPNVVVCDFEIHIPAGSEYPEYYDIIDPPDRCFYISTDLPVTLTPYELQELGGE